MRISRVLQLLVVAIAIAVSSFAQEEHQHSGAPNARLGSVHFENSCRPEVQATLTRAVALLHSFWYDEASREFQAVAEKDKTCGIAWWGVGMSQWHPLWEPNGPNPDKLKVGQDAAEKAKAVSARSEREKGFIAALNKFYGGAPATPHLQRVLAYEQAMNELHSRFPSDHETTVFYALSLLASAGASPPDKSYARQLKAGELLQPVMHDSPDHPGVAHYIIHAYDYPTLAPRALDAARSYAKIAPDAPHALHMPSHIFTRLGYWQESIDSNLASAAAAEKHSLPGDELHALDYLEFAYLQTGQDKRAEEVVQKARLVNGDDAARFAGIYAKVAIPVRNVIERRQWAQAAALPVNGLPGGRYAWSDAAVYFARSIGASRTGKVDAAKTDLAKMAEAKQALIAAKETYWTTQVEIQRQAAEAWVHFAEGRHDAALTEMRAAVTLEDSTDKHPVTPGALVPMRVLLGDMLLESKQPGEAVDVFAALLKTEPNRFAAIYGLARAADAKGDRKFAAENYRKLAELCAKGDMDRAELKQARSYSSSEARK